MMRNLVRPPNVVLRRSSSMRVLVKVLGLTLAAGSALAQEPDWEEAPPREELEPPAPPAPAEPPAPPADVAAPPPAPDSSEGEPSSEGDDSVAIPEAPIDVTEPETPAVTPSLKVGMGIRAGMAMVFDHPESEGPALHLDDGVVNQLNVRPYFSGQLTENIGFTGNFEVTENTVDILDAIIQVKVVDEFQIWFGQHLPAVERNNFNGPFYNNSWNLPIIVQTVPFEIAGRDRGVTLWGLVGGGVLKYHVSAVDLARPASSDLDGVLTRGASVENARFAARATINLLDPENYYYTSGTYYGEQDTLALGAVIHAQKGVDSLDPDVELDNDLFAFTADLLFEKNLGKAGTFTLEGGYWNFDGTGADYIPKMGTTDFGRGIVGPTSGSSYLVGIGWLTPEKVGFGKINPHVKIQIGDYEPDRAVVADFGLGYIIDGFDHRWFLNYRYQDMGGESQPLSMLQIGAQLQL